jgi:hypothetical protein
MVLASNALNTYGETINASNMYREPAPLTEAEEWELTAQSMDALEGQYGMLTDDTLQIEPMSDSSMQIAPTYDPFEALINDALINGIRRLDITDEKLAMIQANEAELKSELLARIKANSAMSQDCMDIDEFGRPRVDERLVNETLAKLVRTIDISDSQGMNPVTKEAPEVEMETPVTVDHSSLMLEEALALTKDSPPAIENGSESLKELSAIALAEIEPSLDKALTGLGHLDDKYQVPLISEDLTRTLRHLNEATAMGVDEPTQVFLLKYGDTIKAMLNAGLNFEVDPWCLTPEVIKHFFNPNYVSPPKPEAKISVPKLPVPGQPFNFEVSYSKYDLYHRMGLPGYGSYLPERPSSTAATLGAKPSPSHKPGPERVSSRWRMSKTYAKRIEPYLSKRGDATRVLVQEIDMCQTEINFSGEAESDQMLQPVARENAYTSVSHLSTRPPVPDLRGSMAERDRRERVRRGPRDDQTVYNEWYGPGT